MLTLCDGMLPLSIHSKDPQFYLVHASIRNHDDVEQKYRTVIAAGSLSIGARVELFRQICQSKYATVGERVSAARSLTALCLHSYQHQHLAHRIGLKLSFYQNRSLGDSSVSIATALYTGAWDVLEALQRHVMPETFGMMASLVRDAEYMRYLASRIPLLGTSGEAAGRARHGANARVVASVQVGPRFAQGFTHRGQSGDAEEALGLGEHGRRWRERGAATELIMVPQVASMTTVTRQDAILRRLAVEHASRAPLPLRGHGEERLYRRYGSFSLPGRRHGPGNSALDRGNSALDRGNRALDRGSRAWGGSRLDPIRSLQMASPRLLQLEIDNHRAISSRLEKQASLIISAEPVQRRVSADAELSMSLSVQSRFEAITGGAQMDRTVLRSEWWRLQITKPRLACELGYIFTGREDWKDVKAEGNATEIRAIDGLQAVPDPGGGGIRSHVQAIIRATQCILSRTAASPWPVMVADGFRRRATTTEQLADAQRFSHPLETRKANSNEEGRRAVRAPPLRLAIASGDLGVHAIGFVIPYMLAWMDRRRVHVTVLSTGKEDEANMDRDNLAGEENTATASIHPAAMNGGTRSAAASSEAGHARTAAPSSLLQRVASTGAVSAAQLHWIYGVAGDDARRMSQSMRLRRVAHRFVGMESVLARFAVDTTDEAFAKREWQRDLVLACYHGNGTVPRAQDRGAVVTFPGWSIIPLRLGHLPMRIPASPTRVEDLVLASDEAAGCDLTVSVVVPSVANSDVVAMYGVDAPYSGDLFPALPFRRLDSMPANLRSSYCQGRAWMSFCGMDGSAIAVLSQSILEGTLTNPSATDQRLVGHLPALAGVADIMYPVRELLRKHGVIDDVTLRARIEHSLLHAPTAFLSEYLSAPLRFAEYGMAADVLIDLSLVTVPPMGPPMSMRPCRVQAAYLGYASTVDSSQLSYDFWIADAALAPPDELPSFGLGWRHRESLQSGVQKNSRLRWNAHSGADQRRAGDECLTCDVVTVTASDSLDEASYNADTSIRRVQLPADKQTGLGVVYMPHSYHPTGAKYGMPACGLDGSTAVQRARRAIACQDDAMLRLLPKLRVWSNAVHRVGVAKTDHMNFVTDPALAHYLRRVALDGGLGERRMQDRTLRDSSPDVGLAWSTVSLGDSAASSMLDRLAQSLSYSTDSAPGRGAAATRRPLFISLPGQTRKTTVLLYDAVCSLLRRVPRARLVLKGPQQSESVQRLVAEAAARGIASHRLLFMHGRVSLARYLDRLLAVDMVFDTYPFGTHSLMVPPATLGVPLVAMRGVPHIGRVATGMLQRIDEGLRVDGAARGVAGLLQGRSFRELTAVSERLLGLPLIGRGKVRSYIARESVRSGYLSDALAGQSLSRATQLMWEVRAAQVGNAVLGAAGEAVKADVCSAAGVGERGALQGEAATGERNSQENPYPCAMPSFDRVLRVRSLERPARSMLLGWVPMHVVVHPESSGRSGSKESTQAARDALRLALDGAALWAGEQAGTYWKLGVAAQGNAAASRAELAGGSTKTSPA